MELDIWATPLIHESARTGATPREERAREQFYMKLNVQNWYGAAQIALSTIFKLGPLQRQPSWKGQMP